MKNKKGFALMEILVVAVAVSTIFISVYSNFFPLKAELENRVLYNSVEAEYAAFYFKKYFNNRIISETCNYNLSINSELKTYKDKFNVEKLAIVTKDKDCSSQEDINNYKNKFLTGTDVYIIVKLNTGKYASTKYNFSTNSKDAAGNYIWPTEEVDESSGTISSGKYKGHTKLGILNLSGNVIVNSVSPITEIDELNISENTTIKSEAFKYVKINKKIIINTKDATIEDNAFNINKIPKGVKTSEHNVSEDSVYNNEAPTIIYTADSNQEYNWCKIFGIPIKTETSNGADPESCMYPYGDVVDDIENPTQVYLHILSSDD